MGPDRGNGDGRRLQVGAARMLTPMERRVSVLVAHGDANAEIAQALELSPKTVEWHLSNVYRKLGVRSRTQLALELLAGASKAHVQHEEESS